MIPQASNLTSIYEIIITVLVAVTGFTVTMLIRVMMGFNKKMADKIDLHTKEIQELQDGIERHNQAFHLCKFYHKKQHNEDIDFNKLLD